MHVRLLFFTVTVTVTILTLERFSMHVLFYDTDTVS